MPNKLRQNDPIASHARKAISTRRIGVGKRCVCGESRPEALIAGTDPIVCARCQRKAIGQSTTDQHHPAGAANDATTIPIDVNDHRADLSVSQRDWERPLVDNPDGCPVIAAASHIRGAVETIIYLLERLVDWIPRMLV